MARPASALHAGREAAAEREVRTWRLCSGSGTACASQAGRLCRRALRHLQPPRRRCARPRGPAGNGWRLSTRCSPKGDPPVLISEFLATTLSLLPSTWVLRLSVDRQVISLYPRSVASTAQMCRAEQGGRGGRGVRPARQDALGASPHAALPVCRVKPAACPLRLGIERARAQPWRAHLCRLRRGPVPSTVCAQFGYRWPRRRSRW
jgi:hypothetical protein